MRVIHVVSDAAAALLLRDAQSKACDVAVNRAIATEAAVTIHFKYIDCVPNDCLRHTIAQMSDTLPPPPTPPSHQDEAFAADATSTISTHEPAPLLQTEHLSAAATFDGVDKDAVSQAIAAALSAVARQQQQELEQQVQKAKTPKPKKAKPVSSLDAAVADGCDAMLMRESQLASEQKKNVKKERPDDVAAAKPLLLLDENGKTSSSISRDIPHHRPLHSLPR